MARTIAGQWWGGIRKLALVGVVVATLAGSQAHADDLTPPTWNRAGANALKAHWGFEDAEHPEQPDSVHNPFNGQVQLHVMEASRHLPTLTGRKGVWIVGDPSKIPGGSLLPPGYMSVSVPNANRPGRKEVWVQVTFLGAAGKPTISIPGFTLAGESVRNADADGQSPYTEDPNPNQPWKHVLSKWTAPSCPASEIVKIEPERGVMIIDQLVIDTICR